MATKQPIEINRQKPVVIMDDETKTRRESAI